MFGSSQTADLTASLNIAEETEEMITKVEFFFWNVKTA